MTKNTYITIAQYLTLQKLLIPDLRTWDEVLWDYNTPHNLQHIPDMVLKDLITLIFLPNNMDIEKNVRT